MELLDSRRLTGPSLLWDRPGAVLEIEAATDVVRRVIETWRDRARAILDAVGWRRQELAVRRYEAGASLAISAPIDALYAACEVNEWAWEAATALLADQPGPDLAEAAAALRQAIKDEASPRLLALRQAAIERDVPFLADDELVTLGYGAGSRSFAVDDLPAPEVVDWGTIHAVPVVLVTGTNGKTTTTRLIAAIAARAGYTAGLCSTDWVRIGDETLDTGDYSGPEGARLVLRDRRVQLAVLETARGGLVRRGLAVPRAAAALVLNIGVDHLGEGGIDDLETLARAKLLISRAVPDGPLILNASDDWLRRLGAAGQLDAIRPLPPVTWFGLDPDAPEVQSSVAAGRPAFVVASDQLRRVGPGGEQVIATVSRIPLTFGGTARFQIENALAAAAAATSIGLPPAAIEEALHGYRPTPESNPGRTNLLELGGGVTALVDFAQNAHGMRALLEMATAMPAVRRAVLLGQAGDRSDEAVRDLVRATWAARPDLVILKEMQKYLRGRPAGEMVALLERELRAAGAPVAAIDCAGSEREAVRRALSWARSGDLLLLILHAERSRILELLGDLQKSGWRPGAPLPTPWDEGADGSSTPR